jgi:hypothetical protein
MDKKILGICILLAAILISGTMIYTTKANRYKVAGGKVFDMSVGKFVIEPTAKPTAEPTKEPKILGDTDWLEKDYEKIVGSKGDFTKVIISGESCTVTEINGHVVNFTVQNNDEISHTAKCTIIYYNENKKPIITKEINLGAIKPDEITSNKFEQFENYKIIKSYKLILEEDSWRIRFEE